jgi:signal transduction histidine kinase
MTSHEFRTPLATILSAQDLLQSYGDRLPQDEKLELYDMIRAGVNRMTRMLERILLLGQAEAHMLECRPQDVDLVALCAELAAEAKTLQPDSRCDVFVDCAPELDERQFDDSLLRHIFGNLLSNAIKYSPAGGQVHLNVSAQGQQTVFEVSDQGIGIPHDEIEDLFESFHRASNVGDIQGTGLGLAIVKQAVDLHGGTVEVQSTVGHGTRFTVRLGLVHA